MTEHQQRAIDLLTKNREELISILKNYDQALSDLPGFACVSSMVYDTEGEAGNYMSNVSLFGSGEGVVSALLDIRNDQPGLFMMAAIHSMERESS